MSRPAPRILALTFLAASQLLFTHAAYAQQPCQAFRETGHSVCGPLLAYWRADLKVSEKWSLGVFQRLNLQTRRFEEQAFTLWRDLHCWDLEFYGRERPEQGWSFGFNLTLRAYPQISASSNRVVSDLFSDAMYGY